MDKAQLLDMVALAREAADKCESQIAELQMKVKSLRANGGDTAEAYGILSTLESEYDHLLMQMNRFLDELDRIAPPERSSRENASSPFSV
jgi:hypothetical protein